VYHLAVKFFPGRALHDALNNLDLTGLVRGIGRALTGQVHQAMTKSAARSTHADS
jgi:hypothetical protein